MPYEYRGDIAHADIAFDAWGKTLEDVFQEAAKATMQVMAENLSAIRQAETFEISLDQRNEEMLLFDFLNELIFYKDARRLFLLPDRLSITTTEEGCSLQATLAGEEIDPQRHRLNTDVKAVTMLRFSLAQVPQGWRATVVLDV
ncbi:archease [Geomonas sp.]|uniref:archease n=1 Tax=Geomonas sp. TaxID=2651584 RepID=UPI002B488093|nr:archease [Geomonas sp.]HJV34675.1 archease [Geomonas sp.]